MKKIIISSKQLAETVTPVQPQGLNVTQQLNNAGKQARNNEIKGYDPTVINNPLAPTNDTVTITAGNNGLKQTDVPIALKAKNIIVTPEKSNNSNDTGTSTANTIMEKAYSKKHIEEVRKFNGRVMTKRELMESWLNYDERPNTIEGIIEKLREETVNAESRLNDYISTLNEISNELQKAVEEIKEELQRNGVNITGTEVNYYGDGFDIKIKTNWVLKGNGFYDDPEDEALYRALSHVTGAPYQIDYGRPYHSDYHYVHFGIEEGDGDDCNPYFEINCNIPDLNNNEEDY